MATRCAELGLKALSTLLAAVLALGLLVRPAASTVAQSIVAPQPPRSLESTSERCDTRQRWGIPDGCGQCAHFLPHRLVEDSEAWLVTLYVNRAHATQGNLRGRTRRSTQRRQLPHQYFVRVMEETLFAIAELDPGAKVNLAVFSEARYGGMVDEVGVPVDWDFSKELCAHAGLQCSKSEILLRTPSRSIAEAVECVASADVFIASEDEFSHAAVALSKNVRILTDAWASDVDEEMVLLDPAATVAGLSTDKRSQLIQVFGEWRECSHGSVTAFQ